jgi:hypothetical protein
MLEVNGSQNSNIVAARPEVLCCTVSPVGKCVFLTSLPMQVRPAVGRRRHCWNQFKRWQTTEAQNIVKYGIYYLVKTKTIHAFTPFPQRLRSILLFVAFSCSVSSPPFAMRDDRLYSMRPQSGWERWKTPQNGGRGPERMQNGDREATEWTQRGLKRPRETAEQWPTEYREV